MSFAAVVVKTLKEAVRQPKNLLLALGLPVAFMVIFGLAFSNTTGPTTANVAVLDEDGGEAALAFVRGMQNATFADGEPAFAVTLVDDAASARRGVEDRTFDLFVRIPANFTEGLAPREESMPPATPLSGPTTRPAPPEGATLEVVGDPAAPRYQEAAPVLAAYAQAFAAEASGMPPLVRIESESVASAELTRFDVMAPGLMIFAMLNLAPQAASALARETELRTLDRIRASPLPATTLLAGVATAHLVLASVSILLMFASATLMGFHNQGSWLDAAAIALVAALSVVGVGMVVAAFATTQQEAANFGILFAVPGGLLSGAFFAVPDFEILAGDGWTVGAYDVLPATHAVEALRATLTFGRPLAEAEPLLLALGALAGLYFAAGVALFARQRLRPE